MNALKKLIRPPVYEDEIKTQQAYLLNLIVWVLVCVPIPLIIYSLILKPDNANQILMLTIIGEAMNFILLILIRRGFVKFASILQVTAFWFFFTMSAAVGAGGKGVQGIAYLLGYGLVIAIAGLLLGGRGASVFTVLSLAAGGLMVFGHANGYLQATSPVSHLTTWVISLVLFPVTAILQYLGARLTRDALARARASKERYRLISEVSSDYTFSTELDAQGNMYLSWVAGAFEEMTGYTYEEYVAAGGWPAHLHPDDVSKDAQDSAMLKANKPVTSEVRTFKKDRELRWVRVYAHPVWDEKENRLSGIIGAVQDITEQKKAEDALRRSESIYRRAIEVAGAVPYHQTLDAEGRVTYDFMGEGIRQISGYGPEEFNENLWDSLVQERNLLEELEPYSLDKAIQKVRIGDIPIWKCEHQIKARDGKIRWVFEAAVDLRDENGTAYGSVGLYQDITERKQSEELLEYERDLLQIFLDNIPDTVYFKDTSSRFVRINRAQTKFLKLNDPEEAIGKTDLDFQPTDLAKQIMAEEKLIVESGEAIINRIEFNPTEDGIPRWLSATKVPVRNSSGTVVGTIGISRDVTEQRLAQEHEQNRRALLEKVILMGQSVTEVKDLKTTLERIWHGIHDVLGFDRLAVFLYNAERNSMDSMIGTTVDGKMQDTSGIWFPIAGWTTFQMVLDKPDGLYTTHNYDVENNIPEGHEMHGVKDYAAVAAWAGSKPVAVICVDQLMSKRKITDPQLEALRLFSGYAGLAIENSRLNEALQAELDERQNLIHELENKNAELERFTYTVSHDLKSPLVTITGFLGYIEKDAMSGNLERVKRSSSRIAGAAKKMQSLLNDLLELSRIGRLMNPPEDVPFDEIVHEAMDHVRGRLDEADAVVEIQPDFPIIHGDRVRLVEVVQNLVENAVKYANPLVGLRIEIGMDGRTEREHPIFFVRDNGIGIEPQFHELIFGLFNKLDALSEGTGIGLSLVKRIVEVHNGRVWVESEKGKGATFYFSLPTPQKKE